MPVSPASQPVPTYRPVGQDASCIKDESCAICAEVLTDSPEKAVVAHTVDGEKYLHPLHKACIESWLHHLQEQPSQRRTRNQRQQLACPLCSVTVDARYLASKRSGSPILNDLDASCAIAGCVAMAALGLAFVLPEIPSQLQSPTLDRFASASCAIALLGYMGAALATKFIAAMFGLRREHGQPPGAAERIFGDCLCAAASLALLALLEASTAQGRLTRDYGGLACIERLYEKGDSVFAQCCLVVVPGTAMWLHHMARGFRIALPELQLD